MYTGYDKMSTTVRVNSKIKEEITPILADLGISLSDAINMFLHQIKLNDGLPFDLRRKKITEINDGYGSYICEQGHVHDYSKFNSTPKEKKDDISPKMYASAKEMMQDILSEKSE